MFSPRALPTVQLDEFRQSLSLFSEEHWRENRYPVCGGMQDFNYLASNCFELTLVLVYRKFSPGKNLPNLWHENHVALMNFIWQVRESPSHATCPSLRFFTRHTFRIKGLITDEEGESVCNATIKIEQLINKHWQYIDRDVNSSK